MKCLTKVWITIKIILMAFYLTIKKKIVIDEFTFAKSCLVQIAPVWLDRDKTLEKIVN